MRRIAKINEDDRKVLFHNTAAKMGMTDAIGYGYNEPWEDRSNTKQDIFNVQTKIVQRNI